MSKTRKDFDESYIQEVTIYDTSQYVGDRSPTVIPATVIEINKSDADTFTVETGGGHRKRGLVVEFHIDDGRLSLCILDYRSCRNEIDEQWVDEHPQLQKDVTEPLAQMQKLSVDHPS